METLSFRRPIASTAPLTARHHAPASTVKGTANGLAS